MEKCKLNIELTKEYIRENLEIKTTYIGNKDKEYKYRIDCTLKSPIGKISHIPRFCDKEYGFEEMVESVMKLENNCEALVYDSNSK